MSGVLSGLIIAVVAAWIWHGFGRLWRDSLGSAAAAALDEAAVLGLRVRPARGRSAWLATGEIEGIPVQIAWAGGIFGERTRIDIGGLKRTTSLICGAAELRAALAGREE